MLKALFFLEIFTFLSWHFGYVEKWLDKKAKINFDISIFMTSQTEWMTNSYNTYIAPYLKK